MIHLKKRLPLPFYKKQQRKSVYIDVKGLYFILKEYRQAVRSDPENPNPDFQFPILAPEFPTAYRRFSPFYADWMQFLFRIDKVLDGKKQFKDTGVGMTTNAVCASVLYEIEHDTTEADNELLRCIKLLSFYPPDDDRTVYSDGCCNAIFNEENMVDRVDVDDNGAGYLKPPICDRTINSDESYIANEEYMVVGEDGDDNGPGYVHDGMFLFPRSLFPHCCQHLMLDPSSYAIFQN